MKYRRKKERMRCAISKMFITGAFFPLLLFSAVIHAQTPTPETAVPGNFVDITDAAGVHFQHQAPHTSKST